MQREEVDLRRGPSGEQPSLMNGVLRDNPKLIKHRQRFCGVRAEKEIIYLLKKLIKIT